MTGPAGVPCPVCGHYLNVFGCTPGACKDPEHAAAPADSAPFIASRPELGEPAMKASQERCPSCGAGLFKADWWRSRTVRVLVSCRTPGCSWNRDTFIGPADPAPWRWEETPHLLRLLDANNAAMFYVEREDNDGRVRRPNPLPSPRVRALTEAAPEMEALLRDLQWSGDSFAGTATVCPRCHRSPERGHRSDCAVGELLARIDERSKGS